MTTTTKSLKDKPHTGTPRLNPRPTAASAARAARNAINRNVSGTPTQRQSPSRPVDTTPAAKLKNVTQRQLQKRDSKTDVKTNRASSEREPTTDDIPVSATNECPSNGSATNIIDVGDAFAATTQHSIERPTSSDPRVNEEFDRFEIQPVEYWSESISSEHTDQNVRRTPLQSRPQTPKSGTSSRPQTPRVSSRPNTPSNVILSHGTPRVSRPSTPQTNSSITRPTTPPTRPRTPPTCVTVAFAKALNIPNTQSAIREEDIKLTFDAKHDEFVRMKMELDLKQQAVLEVFECLRELRDRMCREGISDCGERLNIYQQELVVMNVADWPAAEIEKLCRDAAKCQTAEGAVDIVNFIKPIDECALAELDAKVLDVPARFADLCLQSFTARQELIDWVKTLLESNECGNGEILQRINAFNTQGLELCEALRDLKSCADDAVDAITHLSKQTCRERSALLTVGESLIREVARLRLDLEARTAHEKTRPMIMESDCTKLLDETRRELELEKAAKTAIKDKLATSEAQLRQMRIRVNKMDRQLREAEASISSLTGTVKSLEDQNRQREVQLESRARKLKESLKTGEIASSHLAQQRDDLLAEVTELKERMEALTKKHESTVQELNNQIRDLKTSLEDQKQSLENERKLRKSAETSVEDSNRFIEELKSKIIELQNRIPNPELPTEREMDLWAELQATKETLRVTEDEVTTCKQEKIRFLENLTKIAETENKIGIQQKLASELLSKEEIIGKMQAQLRELSKNSKLNEQKLIQYEEYVRDLQAHNRAVANCNESLNGISYQDLQQEIMNLRMSLLEAVHRNEELSEVVVQKEQLLEHQDKTSRAQARVIKVREELINMLKNKETEQSQELAALQQDLAYRMKIVDNVNKQIAAKANEIQELFSTLDNKQQQIHRLEKIVLALEEQQRRAQAQRTRHEEKIAALEHELAASGHRRDRKFLFF